MVTTVCAAPAQFRWINRRDDMTWIQIEFGDQKFLQNFAEQCETRIECFERGEGRRVARVLILVDTRDQPPSRLLYAAIKNESQNPLREPDSSLPPRRGPNQFALFDAFVRRAAKPKTLSIITYMDSALVRGAGA